MVQKICFIGSRESGKGRTITKLLGGATIVRDDSGLVTQDNTSVRIQCQSGTDLEIIYSQFNGEDSETVCRIKDLTDLETIFVLVLSSTESAASLKIARPLIQNQRVLIYDNRADLSPIDRNWARARPDPDRSLAIRQALDLEETRFVITTKQWAIAPYLKLLMLGLPCWNPDRTFDWVSLLLENENLRAENAILTYNAELLASVTKLEAIRGKLLAQIAVYNKISCKWLIYGSSVLSSTISKEERASWNVKNFFDAPPKAPNMLRGDPTVVIWVQQIYEISLEVSAFSNQYATANPIPPLPISVTSPMPKVFRPSSTIMPTFGSVL